MVQKAQNILTNDENDEKDGEPDCSALQVVESQLKTVSLFHRIGFVQMSSHRSSLVKSFRT